MSTPISLPPDLSRLRPWTLWAKWSSETKGTWHPLLFHLTDVAMCAEAMWDDVLPSAWKRRLAAKLRLTESAARVWVIYLTGLHDLGKACPGFQLQLNLPHIEERLQAAGVNFAPCQWLPHGAVSAIALRTYLPERYGFSADVANAFAVAVGGHHGVFPTASDLSPRALPPPSVGGALWSAVRYRYADWFAEIFELPIDTPPQACDHVAAIMFAGFVSVVDWIGSSETIFEHGVKTPTGAPRLTLTDYRDHARTQARQALKTLGWAGWSPSSVPVTFTEMFPGRTPRPVQQAAIDLADHLHEPALVIIEEQMGEGKTEAAAYIADTWTTRNGQNGMYFALPTQATSNQMFERIRAFLAHRYPADLVNLQLLHGHAALSDVLRSLQDEARARLLNLTSVQDTENGVPHDGAVIAAAWFASGKRAVLAPFGVGTVDQALLATMQVKHFFVRMYGLTTKTVIIDEVHAYDTYMSELIERLLEWLGALGVPVILLSATLPSSRRKRLLDAYLRCADPDPHPDSSRKATPASETPYPRISWASLTSSGARAIAVDEQRRRTVRLEWTDGHLSDGSTAFALGELLQRELADGGCCVVLCNTVRRAQAVYSALKPYFPGTASDNQPQLDLFHARYRQMDRAKRERRSLTRFGAGDHRPDRAVLVATQVVEQSLDLDFDLMVTDHAPVDLLLQRSGRLHRHADRVRPQRLREPRLLFIQPEAIAPGNVPVFDRGSVRVYDEHILLASWLALQHRDELRIPADIEPLIETVYEASACPPELSPELQQVWAASRTQMLKNQDSDAEEARNRYIKRPDANLTLADISAWPREEESPDLHPQLQALTRLTEPTVSLVCLFGSPDHPLLDPDGSPVSLKATPDHRTTRALLERSLTVSDARVVHALLKQQPPTAWEKSSLLRRHRLLIFDSATATANIGRFTLHLDPELGLVVED